MKLALATAAATIALAAAIPSALAQTTQNQSGQSGQSGTLPSPQPGYDASKGNRPGGNNAPSGANTGVPSTGGSSGADSSSGSARMPSDSSSQGMQPGTGSRSMTTDSESGNKGMQSAAGGTQGGPSADQETVRKVQQTLQSEGMQVGQVDGMMGPETESALRQYQQKHNLQPTGKIDSATLSAMKISSSGASGATGTSGSRTN